MNAMDRMRAMDEKIDTSPRNVILVTVDCLRADYVGCYGFHGNISPEIDDLATNGIVFLNAFAHGSNTPLSFPSIITSTLPLSYGGPRFLSKDRISIAEIFKNHGYKTGAIQTNSWLSYQTNYVKGFDEYIELYDLYEDLISRLKFDVNTILNRLGPGNHETEKEILPIFETHFKTLSEGINNSYSKNIDIVNKFNADFAKYKQNPEQYIKNFIAKHRDSKVLTFRHQPQPAKILQSLGLLGIFDELLSVFGAKLSRITRRITNLEKPYADAEDVTKRAIKWIEDHKNEKFFLWIHYMDVHQPYLPGGSYKWPSEMKRYFKLLDLPTYSPYAVDVQRKKIRKNLYAACIRYVDEQIGILKKTLEKLTKETIIVITADHGEELYERGDNNHYSKLYDELIRIPYILSFINAGFSQRKLDALVGHVDIGATLLWLCGINENLGIGRKIL